MDDTSSQEIGLPGFRFHPTEEELLDFYLKRMVFGHTLRSDVIGLLNIYLHDPWKLPGLAKINGEREWYFFVPRDRKHSSGGRPNRTTRNGFWKATGSDRRIMGSSDGKKFIGLRKTLVFYTGRAPRGTKTDWVMNEYRLPDNIHLPQDIVLCRIYRKATSLKVLEQRAAKEEEMTSLRGSSSLTPSPMNSVSNCSQEEDMFPSVKVLKKEVEEEMEIKVVEEEEEMGDEEGQGRKGFPSSCSSLQIPAELEKLSELQLPKLNMDWTQDLFWTQFNSPWLQNLTTYSDILNFQ